MKLKMPLLVLLLGMFIGVSSAQAELQVFPLRVTLSDKQRSAQISVRHKGTLPMKYRISTVFYRMSPNGAMDAVAQTTATDLDASNYFKYSPKQVTLEPNVEQVVRVMLRAPADLPDGEYRCHLHFEGMDEIEKRNDAEAGGNQAQMFLKARMAVAIPIIISKGEIKTEASLSDLKFFRGPQGEQLFSVQMQKKGNGFLYGDFEILKVNDKGEEQSVFIVNGVSSYIDKRVVSFPVGKDALVPGKYKILFKQHVSNGDKVVSSTETVKEL